MLRPAIHFPDYNSRIFLLVILDFCSKLTVNVYWSMSVFTLTVIVQEHFALGGYRLPSDGYFIIPLGSVKTPSHSATVFSHVFPENGDTHWQTKSPFEIEIQVPSFLHGLVPKLYKSCEKVMRVRIKYFEFIYIIKFLCVIFLI